MGGFPLGSVHVVSWPMGFEMLMGLGMVGHVHDRLDCSFNVVLLYVLPLHVSACQKKGLWRTIAKEVRSLGVYGRRSTPGRKQWEDQRRWAQKTEEAQLGMASQRGRGARRTLTPNGPHTGSGLP
ncbi:hypothetical protein NDU88_004985 [Pleurodeles waltl]|uniref:Uncharacterized protein n=1 Tax=Pleurodeles waltl TaxID=8319 RepID=A0AAV7WX05_PLEWA|nr:hypothetical protein NDU88_004985 [Pleurodeles waltl]